MNARKGEYVASNIEAAKQTCPWWFPVFRAVRQGIAFGVLTPGIYKRGAPSDRGKGGILYVADDNLETVGPSGFPPLARAPLQQRIEAADHIVLVACAPLARFYQEAADAALAGKNVVLIEARRETQIEWAEYIRLHAKAGAAVTCGLVDPLTAIGL